MPSGSDAKLAIELRIEDLTPSQLKRIDERLGRVGAQAEKSFSRANKATQAYERTVGRVSRQLAGMFTAAAFVAGLREGIRGFRDFSAAMSEVSTIADATDREIDQLGDRISDLALRLGVADQSVARAQYQVLSAGVGDAAESFDVLTVAAEAAIAGVSTTAQAVDLLTTQLNSLKTEGDVGEVAQQFADLNQATVRLGKTTLPELAQSLGQVLPLAASLGVTAEEVNAAIAALTLGGLSTAEAITQIRAALSVLANPSQLAVGLAEELGVEFSVNAAEGRTFVQVLNELKDATGGSAEQLAVLFPNIRALVGVLALAGTQADAFNSLLVEMQSVAGEAGAAFEKRINGPAKQLDILLTGLDQGFQLMGEDAVEALLQISGGFGDATSNAERLRGTLDDLGEFFSVLALTFNALNVGLATTVAGFLELGAVAGAVEKDVADAATETAKELFDQARLNAEQLLGLEKAQRLSKQAREAEAQAAAEQRERMRALFDAQREVLELSEEIGDIQNADAATLGKILGTYRDLVPEARDLGVVLDTKVSRFLVEAAREAEALRASLGGVAEIMGDPVLGEAVVDTDRLDEGRRRIEELVFAEESLDIMRGEGFERDRARAQARLDINQAELDQLVEEGRITRELADQRLAALDAQYQRELDLINQRERSSGVDAQADSLAALNAEAQEFIASQQTLDRWNRELARSSSGFGDSFSRGLNDAAERLLDVNRIAEEAGAAFIGVADQGIRRFSDELVETGTISKEFFEDLLKNLAKVALQSAILSGVSAVLPGVGGGFRFEEGGVMRGRMGAPMPVKAYARGGIADSPQLALFGEGRQSEAFVPLPDGRSIPVTMSGAQQAVTVNLNVQSLDPTTAADVILANVPLITQQIADGIQGGENRAIVEAVRSTR